MFTIRQSLLILSIPIWTAFQTAQLLYIRDYWDLQALSNGERTSNNQIIGLMVFLGFVLGALLLSKRFNKPINDKYSALIYTLLLYFLITSFWSISPLKSLLYATALVIIVFCLHQLALSNQLHLSLQITSFVIIFFFCMAFFNLGLSGRFIGGNQPNLMGAIAFTGIVLSFLFTTRWLRYGIIIFQCAVIILVGSRTYMVGGLLYLMTYFALCRNIKPFYKVLMFASIITGAFSAFQLSPQIQSIVYELSAIDDEKRGIGTGFTGRTIHWNNALSLFSERPMFGYGFRTRESIFAVDHTRASGHSGYLNLLVDTGLVGLMMFLLVVSMAIYKRWKLFGYSVKYTHQETKTQIRQFRFHHALLAAWPFQLIVLFSEPTHLYFSMPSHILLICMLVGFQGKERNSTHRFNYIPTQQMVISKV